jgi:hypothetical protein
MAVTASIYNHTRDKVSSLSIDDEAANFKFMLLDGTTAFDATHTTIAQVSDSSADEVSGNGWDAGGEAVAGIAVSIVNTSHMKIDGTDMSVTASGGNIAAPAGVLFVDEGGLGSTLTPLVHYDFGETITAGDGTPFLVNWPATGIMNTAAAA